MKQLLAFFNSVVFSFQFEKGIDPIWEDFDFLYEK